MLQSGEAGCGVGDGTVEQQRGCARGPLAKEGIEEVLGRSAAGAPRAEDHAQAVVALRRNRRAGIVERHLRRCDRIDAGAIHPAHLHGRNPGGRVEPGDLRGEDRSTARGVEPAERRDAAPAFEERIAEARVRRAERRNDADA